MPFNKKPKENQPLRIDHLPNDIVEPLNNIAKNLGITMTEFLKPHIRKIVDKYPEYKKKKSKKHCARLKITNVSPELVEAVYNVSDNLGIGYSSFLKMEFRNIKDEYPDRMAKPPSEF